jgi:glycosyltransferase involved in cell wall biosynthesis
MSLTVLMTTYNCAPYIRQAIKSILIQTYKDFELLIVDDGSTDNTEEIVKNFSDMRIRYIKRNHIGRSSALNFGLKNSSNDIIALMDADDISHPERLELQVKNYSNNSNEVVFTTAAYFKNNKIVFKGESSANHDQIYKKLALHGPYNNATALFNRKLFLENNGYDESIVFGEDHEIWLRLKNFLEFKQLKNVLYFIRFRDSSLSHDHFSANKNITYNFLERYYKNLTEHFYISSNEGVKKIKGWREYFYGSKSQCRHEWSRLKLNYWDVKILFAYMISFLPENIFNLFKKNRTRSRMQFWISRIKDKNTLQKRFDSILNAIMS